MPGRANSAKPPAAIERSDDQRELGAIAVDQPARPARKRGTSAG